MMCRFVFCRQRSDERLKRGGEQKSVAVLSSLPYSSVLTPLSQHAGPLYFNKGPSALQQVGAPISVMHHAAVILLRAQISKEWTTSSLMTLRPTAGV